jgi:hypothetical protein
MNLSAPASNTNKGHEGDGDVVHHGVGVRHGRTRDRESTIRNSYRVPSMSDLSVAQQLEHIIHVFETLPYRSCMGSEVDAYLIHW